jgi:acetyltransferase-like isoleucine patch superfamily enzyme
MTDRNDNSRKSEALPGLVRSIILRQIVSAVLIVIPWSVGRHIGGLLLGWQVAPTARVGLSFIASTRLIMGDRARIGHFNAVLGIDAVQLGDNAEIGNFNWIGGVDSHRKGFFSSQTRDPRLVLERHARVTSRHLIDCCDLVTIGEFTIVAGARTQIVSHGINIKINRQQTAPVSIGRYCYVGTSCIILKGATLPDFCVLGAGSLLTQAFSDTYCLYSGLPAQSVKKLSEDSLFFSRKHGHVE